jgi:hypothetical protein
VEFVVLTGPCVGVSDGTLHTGIESPVILLDPEGTIRAVSGGFLSKEEPSLTSYLLDGDWNVSGKICVQLTDRQGKIGRGLV